jgi:hypothetical protein
MSIKIQGNVVIDDTSNFTANTITMSGGMYENFTSPTISGGTLTLDLSQGNLFNVAHNAAVNTLSIINPPTSKVGVFVLILNYNGTGYSFTWPASVRWPSGTSPITTTTNGKRDVFAFLTCDNGTSYNGIISGLNF